MLMGMLCAQILKLGAIEGESMATIGSIDGDSIPSQETGHSKQKHIPKQSESDALNRCLCGVVLHSEPNRVLKLQVL